MKSEKEIRNEIIYLSNLIFEDETRIENYLTMFIDEPEKDSDERHNAVIRMKIKLFEKRISRNYQKLNALNWVLGLED